ncbi:MAG TPA: GntR family transcriptional regulator [Acidimicrobiia bacterium]|nr:GntR family transcriptional regulator [Acidimicrobiia bacterium]
MGSPDRRDAAVVSRVERAYQGLRKAIIDGDFPPGSPLRVDRLGRAYGVSLIPIREALRKLEVERLVEAIPNKGVRVAPISLDDLQDVYATRITLELQALRQAWPRMDRRFITEVRGVRRRMVDSLREPDPTSAYELHRQVHFAIYERSESPWLMHLIEILWSHTERYRRLVARLGTFIDEGRDLHGRILDAIADRDLKGACSALQRDLERTPNLILAAEELVTPRKSGENQDPLPIT